MIDKPNTDSKETTSHKPKTEQDVTRQIARITSNLVKRANKMVSDEELNSPSRHASGIKDGTTTIMVTNPNSKPVKQIASSTVDEQGITHYHDAAAERSHGVRTLSDEQWTGHSGEFHWAEDTIPKQATEHLTQDQVIQGSAQTLSAIRDAVAQAESHRQKVA